MTATTPELWERYLKERSVALRNELAVRSDKLVFFVQTRKYGWATNTALGDDMISYGRMAMLGAIEDYNPALGKFSTFAYSRLWAAMQRACRKEDNISVGHRRAGLSCSVVPTSTLDKEDRAAFASQIAAGVLDDEICAKEISEILDRYLSSLVPRQARVLRSRFFERKTLEEVGSELGLTKERIRQLEIQALSKIRRIAMRDGQLARAMSP